MKNLSFIFILLIVFQTSYTDEGTCDGDSCKKATKQCDEDGDEPCFFDDLDEDNSTPVILRTDKDNYPIYEKLSRIQGAKKAGDVLESTVDGKTYKILTRAMKPLLFEIPDAISEDEILHIKEKTNFFTDGLFKSEARGGLTPEDTFKPSNRKGKGQGPAADFGNWDLNDDKIIDLDEIASFCRNYNFLYFNEDDVKEMFQKLEITEFSDGKITKEEFETFNTLGVEDYLNVVMREHPKHRQRTSEQVWLPMGEEYDPVLAKLRERYGKLFHIPHHILKGSEHMQVVRYTPGGHYHAHHDTETHRESAKPCCHQTSTATIKQHGRCRLCRLMTIMFYLEAPEDGGETAFPAADNITYSEAENRRHGYPAKDLYNMNEHCYDANVVVKPKKGTAVAWYNHHVDPSTGWLGEMDEWSLHGGCEVRKGEKWIANLWLTAPYAKDVDKMSMYSPEYADLMKDTEEFKQR